MPAPPALRHTRPSVAGNDAADPPVRLAPSLEADPRRRRSLASGTTATMPIPRLNVRRISASATLPVSCIQRKRGGTGQVPRSISAAVPSGRMRGMLSVSPPPVMCARPRDEVRRRARPAAPAGRSGARPAAPRPPSSPSASTLSCTLRPRDLEEELAGQGVAVGVQPGGGEADEDVPGTRCAEPSSTVRAVHHADDEARDVVLALGVEARHLGRLAAEQGAAVLPAAAGDAGDHRGQHLGIELARRHVVHEEERARRPATRMSFTQWFTRSRPTVSCMPAAIATLSLVPTPSMLLTRTGRFSRRCARS